MQDWVDLVSWLHILIQFTGRRQVCSLGQSESTLQTISRLAGPTTGSLGRRTALRLDKCCPKCAGDDFNDVGTGNYEVDWERVLLRFLLATILNITVDCRLFNAARLFSPSRKIPGCFRAPVFIQFWVFVLCACLCGRVWVFQVLTGKGGI